MYYGIEVRQELIFKSAKTNARVGTLISGMLSTLDMYGLQYDSSEMTLDEIKGYLDKKIPVLILLQAWSLKTDDYAKHYGDSHWVAAIGYDKQNIYFEDPYAFNRVFLTQKAFLERWHARESKKKIKNHGIAVYGKKPVYHTDTIVPML